MDTILKPEHIQKYYGNEGGLTKSIKDISFSEEAGEFLGIFRRENLGFVFQNFNLLDTLIISENIASTLSINKIEPRITEMAKSLSILDGISKLILLRPIINIYQFCQKGARFIFTLLPIHI